MLFGLLAILVDDNDRRQVALLGAGVAVLIFCLSGVAIGIGSSRHVYNYSTDELLLLANDAERRGQYETAIDRLQELEGRLNGQAAQDNVAKRINRLQTAQSGSLLPK